MSAQKLTCQDVIGLLLEYLEQALTPEVLAEFQTHLDGCPACIAYLNTYRKTLELTGQVTRVPMPEDMKVRLRAFLLEKFARGA